MQGGFKPVVIGLLILLSVATFAIESIESDSVPSDSLSKKEMTYHSDSRQVYSWDISNDSWYSIQTNCATCITALTLNEIEIDSGKSLYSGQSNNHGKLELTIDNPQGELYQISSLVDIDDAFPNTRPAPSTQFDLIQPAVCSDASQCVEKNSPLLASFRTIAIDNGLRNISGILDNQQHEFFGFNISSGDSIEFSIEHTSSDILFEAFWQNATSELELGNISAASIPTNFAQTPNVEFTNIDHDGRILIRVSSQTVNTIWSLGIVVHSESQSSMIDLSQSSDIFGHNSRTIIFDLDDTTSTILLPRINDVNYSFYSLISGQWLLTGDGTIYRDTPTKIYPLPTSTALKLTVSAEVFYIQASTENFGDLQSGLEAPSVPPMKISTDNSSWPLLNMSNQNLEGQFTKSIRDTSDVYRIEIDAWEDSIHFIMIEIEGDINLFEIELIEKNQEDWSEVQSKVKTKTLGKLSVALEVSRGTHFFRISLINNTINSTWGEDVEPISYTMSTTYELVDEGDEPWFPPDENAKKWGTVARWFMGLLFLAPALYLGILQYRKKSYAKVLATKQQRLAWLKSRLDQGISPKQNRKELAKSLDAVATLDWDEACQTWGEADLVYRTDNVAIACWNVDARISKTKDAWPIIIGIYTIKGTWEIAALRLDSPEGEAWEINSVTPRFLHSGYEVFLDTLNPGNKTFLSVELSGTANLVDIELNGRLDGQPFACRTSKTLYRDEEE